MVTVTKMEEPPVLDETERATPPAPAPRTRH
jgi:hypothetical protein